MSDGQNQWFTAVDIAAWCRTQARKGADALHARSATPTRAPKLTDHESAAIARAKIEGGQS